MNLSTLPAPARRVAGLALIGASVGFTGLLVFFNVLLELFS